MTSTNKPPTTPTASASDPRDTPAMRQYYRFKREHPGCVLLFRIGDFYEMFDEDALAVSKAIGLTLTQRSAGVPMAGMPYHQLDVYLRRLLAAGFRVAVCDQTQEASAAKGLIERAVTRVLTPGTLVDESLLADDQAAALGAVCWPMGDDGPAALAVAELSTGAFTIVTATGAQLTDELSRRGVTEVVYPETVNGEPPARLTSAIRALSVAATGAGQWHFRLEEARQALHEQYGVKTLAGFGLSDDDTGIAAAGALIRYLRATQAPDGSAARGALKHLRPPRREEVGDALVIDAGSLRSLEIDRTIRAQAGRAEGEVGGEGSLLSIFSTRGRAGGGRGAACQTAMGKRLLRQWLCRPLRDRGAIEKRQGIVGLLVEDQRLAGELSGRLAEIQDVERIGARVALGRATPRDVVALGRSLAVVESLVEVLRGAPALAGHLAEVEGVGAELRPLAERVLAVCVESPPAHLREGGLVRDGIDAALDEARQLRSNAGEWLARYQAKLVEQFELPNLKVGYNKIFGYYIELPKAQSQRAPAEFSRRQTLTNAERYITPELKDFEDKAATAEGRALAREQAIFDELCASAGRVLDGIGRFARATAELDVLLCFAEKARARGWTRPRMVEEPVLEIRQGRHPVLDELLEGDFVPNDVRLGRAAGEGGARLRLADEVAAEQGAEDELGDGSALALITGPNMAGKSTFIRQTALIVILAHTGSFVPAAGATVGITDRVFTRVGADDALFAGQSTFMVEMTETANILHHATGRSLVVLDEIGRGTSTLDGLSLAWAITETLAAGDGAGPRTLFATHYHELTQLQEMLPGRVKNLHVAVKEWEGEIVFLHRIALGRAEGSFGIHVARLAGVPTATIERAREVLGSLAVEHTGVLGAAGGGAAGHSKGASGAGGAGAARGQLSLFTEYVQHPVMDELKKVKLETLSPMQAFDLLRKLKEKAAE